MIMERSALRRGAFLLMLVLFAIALLMVWQNGGIPGVTESVLVQKEEAEVFSLELTAVQGDCLGLPILPESTLEKLTYKETDYSEGLLFGGKPAPVDKQTATIYLSQSIEKGTLPEKLTGALELPLQRCRMYFTEDEAFTDLYAAMGNGHTFRLVVENTENGTYMEYGIVFTNLPVMRMEGGPSGYYDDNRVLSKGDMTLYTPVDPETGSYTVKGCRILWHPRGGATIYREKQPWKLELLDGKQQTLPMNLLGLGAEDDWNLNAMSYDDTYVKERFCMDVWNELAEAAPNTPEMSRGEYVEVICSGKYMGLYLLQRRIDAGYLGLEEQDVLLKGFSYWEGEESIVGYEVKSSPFGEAETLALMNDPASIADVDSFIDTYLFLQWGAMFDNCYYKNMYYLLRLQDNDYRLFFIPWDTDLSLGVWFGDGFEYQMEISRDCDMERMEYEAVKALHPDFDTRAAARWTQLRESVYSEQHLFEKLEKYRLQLYSSGAFTRNKAIWGDTYNEQDTHENLDIWLEYRLEFLDALFAEKARA